MDSDCKILTISRKSCKAEALLKFNSTLYFVTVWYCVTLTHPLLSFFVFVASNGSEVCLSFFSVSSIFRHLHLALINITYDESFHQTSFDCD